MDLSVGMLGGLRVAQVGARGCLPMRTGWADTALAMHMLYHVPDRRAAIAELRRIVRAQGTVVVVTNGTDHLRELDELLTSAVAEVAGTPVDPVGRNFLTFTVEHGGTELQEQFRQVRVRSAHSALHITAPEPVVAYARSMSAFLTMAGDISVETVLRVVHERVGEAIARHGEFPVTTSVGCFICT